MKIFNKAWSKNELPTQWNHSILIPVPKKDQDKTKPSSYRPIALTSVLCKLMERMLLNRLTWFFDKINFNPLQSGFRSGRNTIDHLLRLETDARKAIANKEYLVTIYRDNTSKFQSHCANSLIS